MRSRGEYSSQVQRVEGQFQEGDGKVLVLGGEEGFGGGSGHTNRTGEISSARQPENNVRGLLCPFPHN